MIPDAKEIARLLEPYLTAQVHVLEPDSATVVHSPPRSEFHNFLLLQGYLELILKWNAHTNLTAIRDPAEIVTRHFGESLFLGRHLARKGSVLDFGSGAGFPGIPVQLLRPELSVVLAESQNKKASFLREAVRVLDLPTEVWHGRIEPSLGRGFDAVIMRAVDNPVRALQTASCLCQSIYLLGTNEQEVSLSGALSQFKLVRTSVVPDGSKRVVLHFRSERAFHVEHA